MVSAAETLRTLGQSRRGAREAAVVKLAREGFPASVIARLAQAYDAPIETIEALLGISRTTGKRRRARNATLPPVASDRALRLARIYALGRSVFEDDAKAAGWFKDRNQVLRGERPLDLLDTELGTERVRHLLMQIEYGIYS